MGGCDPSGTGSVKVHDRAKIEEKLNQGARANLKGGKAVEEQGIKFRKKG
jgi:hypothetical protein